ncbi:hypothetical protein BT63DRAFT_447338 [Microthyrium microscopicum]|uniref:ER-bound oxygenase mpaB/mpaB'/Rubber oxygenase catalytic domain-containing protein n=1 Tax=Microthyrium microscopicum TaxID=703497 RepID=A0A6A6UB44_9PEZI|nr:hypothetical protein BT63DRAFT_447338 [Microthyrium microscopicum]
MSVPIPFYRDTPNTRRRWGYTFENTPEHLTLEKMQPLKHSYDKMADDCLIELYRIRDESKQPKQDAELQAEVSQAQSGLEKPAAKGPDLLTLLRDNKHSHPAITKFWDHVNELPPWVSWTQIERGQDVFYRYGGAVLTGLAFQSLLGGMGGARVVETLTRTGAFSTKSARKRLYETTQHLLQITQNLDSVKPGGKGWESSVRVRLLHAMVRQRILKLEKEKPGYYDVESYGMPVSDLDSIGTIMTFSSSLLWQSLPRQGLFPSSQECEDYVALWRYIGNLMGTPTESYFDSAASARRTLESLLLYEIDPSPTSRVLSYNLIAALSNSPPIYASPDMLLATARWLLGHELCDALGLGRPRSWFYYALMAGQCIFFMFAVYSARLIHAWDVRKQAFLRKAFWVMIVESDTGLKGREASFDMKWVPRHGKTTVKEQWREKEKGEPAGIEMRNLKALAYGVLSLTAVVVLSWVSLRVLLKN